MQSERSRKEGAAARDDGCVRTDGQQGQAKRVRSGAGSERLGIRARQIRYAGPATRLHPPVRADAATKQAAAKAAANAAAKAAGRGRAQYARPRQAAKAGDERGSGTVSGCLKAGIERGRWGGNDTNVQ